MTKHIKSDDKAEPLHLKAKLKELEEQGTKLKQSAPNQSAINRIAELDPLVQNWMKVFSEGTEPNLHNDKDLNDFKEFIKAQFKDHTKENLLEIVSDAYGVCYRLKHLLDIANANLKHVLSLKIKSDQKATKDYLARNNGTRFNHSIDNERMKECIELLRNELDRELEPTDFPAFVLLLKSTYPLPVYVKRPRVTAKEGKLNPEEIEERIQEKFDPNWKESTLRKSWTEHTGLKATRKKLSTLK